MAFDNWLRALGKLEYVQGTAKPDVECILCSVRDNDERVVSLKFYQDEIIFVCLNLYPYNPAHMMIVPNRHVLNFEDISKAEMERMFRAVQGLQLMLNDLYNPAGYNIGFNQGTGGASIPHIHCHLVPRYGSELGYMDIIGNTRVVVEGIDSVKQKMEESVHKYLNKEFFESFK